MSRYFFNSVVIVHIGRLMNNVIAAAFGVYVWSDNGRSFFFCIVRYCCVGAVMFASIRYCGVGAVTVVPGVLGCGITFAALVCSTGPWFLVVADWRHSVWVMVMGVGILGLMLIWFR